MYKYGKLILVAGLALSLAACVAGSGDSHASVNRGEFAQFLLGIWHGIIAPFTLLGEVINSIAPGLLPWKVRFFEADGTGVAYDIGFYLMVIGGPSALFGRFSRRRV